jgi:tetratricopeptide (TPR) repeat protein
MAKLGNERPTPASDPAPDLSSRAGAASREFQENYSLSAEQAQAHYTLAMELRNHVGADPERFADVELASGEDVLWWLLHLPLELARHGRVDEAVNLCAQWAQVDEAGNFLGDRAIIFAEAGRREEAIAQCQDNLSRWPTDPWILIKGGDVHARLGEKGRAETLYRQGLEHAGDDRFTREGALERLIPLLHEMGRSAEADALEAAETQRETARRVTEAAEAAGAMELPFVRPAPKIGRNDPCPCGSGKKHKKCCLSDSSLAPRGRGPG